MSTSTLVKSAEQIAAEVAAYDALHGEPQVDVNDLDDDEDREHGTEATWMWHRRRGESSREACRVGYNRAAQDRKASRNAAQPPSAALLDATAGHPDRRVSRAHVKVMEALAVLDDVYRDWKAGQAQRDRLERERRTALTEVEVAEEALRVAREKARSLGLKRTSRQVPGTPSTDGKAARAAGVNRMWHERGKHTSPKAGCPLCEATA